MDADDDKQSVLKVPQQLIHLGLSRPRRMNVTPPSRPLTQAVSNRVQQFESTDELLVKRSNRRFQYRKVFCKKDNGDFIVHARARSAAPTSNRTKINEKNSEKKVSTSIPFNKITTTLITTNQLSKSDEDVSSVERLKLKTHFVARERAAILASQLPESKLFNSRAAQLANGDENVVDRRRLSCFGFVRKSVVGEDMDSYGMSGMTVKQRIKLYDQVGNGGK
ncbi:hypothetical protein ACOME3_001419 [Neoechinorhynchus agilis]